MSIRRASRNLTFILDGVLYRSVSKWDVKRATADFCETYMAMTTQGGDDDDSWALTVAVEDDHTQQRHVFDVTREHGTLKVRRSKKNVISVLHVVEEICDR